jgi:hypothetical protein
MTSPSDHSSNEMPNIGTVLVHKREHFETYQAHLHAKDPCAYQNYTLREVLESINGFHELTRYASDTLGILDGSNSLASIDKLHFQPELSRICELSESVTADLNCIVDQICRGKKSPQAFRKIEPNILLLRRLIDRVVGWLDLIIEQEIAFD